MLWSIKPLRHRWPKRVTLSSWRRILWHVLFIKGWISLRQFLLHLSPACLPRCFISWCWGLFCWGLVSCIGAGDLRWSLLVKVAVVWPGLELVAPGFCEVSGSVAGLWWVVYHLGQQVGTEMHVDEELHLSYIQKIGGVCFSWTLRQWYEKCPTLWLLLFW